MLCYDLSKYANAYRMKKMTAKIATHHTFGVLALLVQVTGDMLIPSITKQEWESIMQKLKRLGARLSLWASGVQVMILRVDNVYGTI